MRCDVHPDTAGVLLIQNLVEGKILVCCQDCGHDMIMQLCVAWGVDQTIAEAAQDALYKEVEAQKAAKAQSRSGKGAGKSVEPQDTGDAGASTVAPE